jgi:molybdopterin converting factor small subunit
MKIGLRLYGFDELVPILGGKELEIQFEGHTYGDLIHHLGEKYGDAVAKLLRQQVIRNSRQWIPGNELGFLLEDGDRLMFIPMMGGG